MERKRKERKRMERKRMGKKRMTSLFFVRSLEQLYDTN
jgi:hypothetical protein